MTEESLAIDQLAIWAELNHVDFNGVKACSVAEGKGTGLIATWELQDSAVLLSVPQDLVLSLENVWIYAKSDQHLSQVLEAVGDYSRVNLKCFPAYAQNSMKRTNAGQTARGAILIFLLLQLTNSRTQGKIGVLNPFTEYIRYLPKQTSLPTFWSDAEKSLLIGTSLEAALESKLKNLSDDFTLIQARTISIAWCRQYWWDTECVTRTFSDWKQVDALYRSRALDLPGTGHAVVPCVDMANHASGDETTAIYETAPDGSAVLCLRAGKKVHPGDEITISYGDEKGACEMLYSYGFIEDTMMSAKELFLDLDIPDDDPLRKLKRQVAKVPPGFRLYLQTQDDVTGWQGAFVWLCCINEEDGLEFKELQDSNGERELQASWKDQDISDFESFEEILKNEPAWDIYLLRATVLLYERVTEQLLRLENSEEYVQELWEIEDLDDYVYDKAMRLRDLEQTLLLQAFEEFDTKKVRLQESSVVKEYLASANVGEEQVPEDDFS